MDIPEDTSEVGPAISVRLDPQQLPGRAERDRLCHGCIEKAEQSGQFAVELFDRSIEFPIHNGEHFIIDGTGTVDQKQDVPKLLIALIEIREKKPGIVKASVRRLERIVTPVLRWTRFSEYDP